MALITLDHVSKIYPRGTRPALDDVSLDINRGDFVFLVGASGSGKTTLLSLLLREEEATDGEIRVAGHDLRRITNRQVPQYRRSIGFVFQDYKLLNNKTVWQNVAFALEVIGTRRSTIKSLVPKVLETVGLTGKERNYPHELSGGEQQRVAIARAYVNHPQILLADEPTGNLDPTTSLGIMEVLDAINRTGTTIVMATHNEEIVNSMRKRVVELHGGKIVRDEEHGSYDSAEFFPDAAVEAQAQQAIRGGARGVAAIGAGQSDAGAPGTGRFEAAQAEAVQSGMAGTDADARFAAGGRTALASNGDGGADGVQTSGGAAGASDAAGLADMVRAAGHGRKMDRGTLAEQTADIVAQSMGQSEDEGIARLAQSVHSGRTGRYGEAFAPVETTLTWGKGLNLDTPTPPPSASEVPASPTEGETGTQTTIPVDAPSPLPPAASEVSASPTEEETGTPVLPPSAREVAAKRPEGEIDATTPATLITSAAPLTPPTPPTPPSPPAPPAPPRPSADAGGEPVTGIPEETNDNPEEAR